MYRRTHVHVNIVHLKCGVSNDLVLKLKNKTTKKTFRILRSEDLPRQKEKQKYPCKLQRGTTAQLHRYSFRFSRTIRYLIAKFMNDSMLTVISLLAHNDTKYCLSGINKNSSVSSPENP